MKVVQADKKPLRCSLCGQFCRLAVSEENAQTGERDFLCGKCLHNAGSLLEMHDDAKATEYVPATGDIVTDGARIGVVARPSEGELAAMVCWGPSIRSVADIAKHAQQTAMRASKLTFLGIMTGAVRKESDDGRS